MPTHYRRAFAVYRRPGGGLATAAFVCLGLLAASPALTAQTAADQIISNYIGAVDNLANRLRGMSDADRAQREALELPRLIDNLNPLVAQMKTVYGNPASQPALQMNADRLNIAQTRLQQQQSRVLTGDCALIASATSLNTNAPIRVDFVNMTRERIHIYWFRGLNDRISHGTLEPATTKPVNTYVTHSWVMTNAAGACLNLFQLTSAGTYNINGSLAPTLGPFLAKLAK